jgi:uncharacterized protein (DUF1684 family)
MRPFLLALTGRRAIAPAHLVRGAILARAAGRPVRSVASASGRYDDAMSDAPGAELQLADWRRRVAKLYADVRFLYPDDPVAAWQLWRADREALFQGHPQSPVPAADRAAFRAHHWGYDPRLAFEASVVADPPAPSGGLGLSLELPNSGADVLSFRRIGSVSFPFAEGPRDLSLFWMAGYVGGLFLPFRDATNGTETYGAGRYLIDAAKSADLGGDPLRGTVICDFNFAYQPSCAFDPQWACPLPPPANRLDLAVHPGAPIA